MQAEITRRVRGKNRYSGVGIFSSRIKCAECGSWYGAKVWHSNDKYRRVIYQCNHKFNGEKKCSTPHLTEDEIMTAFVTAYNRFLEDKDEIIRNMEVVIGQLSDSGGLEMEREKLEQEMTVLAEMVRNCLDENARTTMDQGKYQERYSGLAERYETLKEKHDMVSGEIAAEDFPAGKPFCCLEVVTNSLEKVIISYLVRETIKQTEADIMVKNNTETDQRTA